MKKSQKISKNHFFFKKFFLLNFFFCRKKRKKKMHSSQFSNIRRTRFDQSSPVQPVSESRGGSTSVTEKKNEQRKSLCLIFDVGQTLSLLVSSTEASLYWSVGQTLSLLVCSTDPLWSVGKTLSLLVCRTEASLQWSVGQKLLFTGQQD